MKRFNWNILPVALMLLGGFSAWAEAPAGYYDAAKGKNKEALLTALNGIVGPHTAVSYDKLWTVYKSSDVTADGYIWDMYATTKFVPGKNQCGSYSAVGSCYNREHSFPKSWFNDASPMYSDAYHIYPTDGKVNGQRSNYPFGECDKGTYLATNGSNKPLGKLGACTFPGYSGTVFEPDDQYKGDFARTYFYMAATYKSRISSWNSAMLSGDDYPCYKTWAINLLLKWSREDPVSQKEIDRNDAVSSYQKNRNPFIDHPELAEYIWGNQMSNGWTPGGNVSPVLISPTDGASYDCGITAVGKPLTMDIPVKASGLTEELGVSVSGAGFSVSPASISLADALAGSQVRVTYSPASAGTHTATVTIFSGEVASTVNVKATAVDGIPAQSASSITTDGFTANWLNVDGSAATYSLSLFESDAATLVAGYPVNVASSAQSRAVTGLDYNTVYYYQLSCGDRVSNMVKVTTAMPDQILAIVSPDGGFQFSAQPGTASEILEGSVYTEYITEPITASVTGNFQISKNRTDWASSVTIDPDGESFYVRMADTANEGEYTGDVSVNTATVDGEEVPLTGVVSFPRTFFEDFEKMETQNSYNGGSNLQGTASRWTLTNVGVCGRTSGDRFNGTKGICTGKSGSRSLMMTEDKLLGAGTVTLNAAPYAGDGESTLAVSYSTDGGSNWTLFETVTVSDAVLSEFVFKMNVAGAVRLKLEQKTGKRLCIDDISITDYKSSGVVSAAADKQWTAYAVAGGLTIDTSCPATVEVYAVDATMAFSGAVESGQHTIALDKGVYIVVSGDCSQKVIVK